MNKVRILTLSYPRPASPKEIVFSSAFFAISIYFFLAVFQPFGTYNFYHPLKYILLIPYSLIAFLTCASTDFMVAKRLGNWKLAHEVLKLIIILTICSAINYVYSATFVNRDGYSVAGLMYMALFSFALSAPVTIIYLLGKYVYLRKSVDNAYPVLPPIPPSAATTATALLIKPHTGDSLHISENAFLFAESIGNYCNVVYLDKNVLKKQLLRISLKGLEEQIGSDSIARCHRSYIINMAKIVSAKGNAQGYQLNIAESEAVIPVSRSYIAGIRNGTSGFCRS